MTGVLLQTIKGAMPDRPLLPGDVPLFGESLDAGIITTVGNGTWTGAAIASGYITRSGPVGGYTDTTDSAVNILAALAGNFPISEVSPGSTFRMFVANTVAQALTLAAGTGVILGTKGSGVVNIAASLVREYLVTIKAAAPAVTLQAAYTNGSPVVTFNLPPGMNAFKLGPAPDAINIVPGMTFTSGTAGVTTGTTVIGITQGQGGVTGVTLSANTTSNQGNASVTFSPTIQIDGLSSNTL